MNKYLEKIAQIGAVDWHVRGHGDLSHRDEVLGAMGIGAGAALIHPTYTIARGLKNGIYRNTPTGGMLKQMGKTVGRYGAIGAAGGLAMHTIGSELRRRKMNNALAQYEHTV